MKHSFSAESDVGLRRASNEDAWLADQELGLFVVCDGMGGHEAGELASRTAAEAVVRHVRAALGGPGRGRRRVDPERAIAALRAAAVAAHHQVSSEAQRLQQVRHMGTTLVAALLLDDTAVVASVGDSRAYLVAGDRTRRVTSDHTLAEQYAELGLIAADSVPSHPLRHVLVRVIGGCGEASLPDVFQVPLETGDRLLLCTDGLSEMLDDERIVAIAGAAPDTGAAVAELTRAALDNGGVDNVTTLIVERRPGRTSTRRRPAPVRSRGLAELTPCAAGARAAR